MISGLTNMLKRAVGHAAGMAALSSTERQLVRRVRAAHLTYLDDRKLASLIATCRRIREQQLPGSFLEAGCALGGSTILIASIKERVRPLRVYDVFGMIPPPGERDTPDVHDRYRDIAAGRATGIGGDEYYGYQDGLRDKVLSNLRRHGIDPDRDHVSLIQGLVQDTLTVDGPVAFAHVDVDWYDPVMTCLQRIFPQLSRGGSIILDDYHDWGGCRQATDEFLAEHSGKVECDDSAGSLKITRVAG